MIVTFYDVLHLMHTVAVTAGSRGWGGAIIPAIARDAAHTFYILRLRVRDGGEKTGRRTQFVFGGQ